MGWAIYIYILYMSIIYRRVNNNRSSIIRRLVKKLYLTLVLQSLLQHIRERSII